MGTEDVPEFGVNVRPCCTFLLLEGKVFTATEFSTPFSHGTLTNVTAPVPTPNQYVS